MARFGDDDVARLLADAGIVRNRQKIEATIHNAGVVAGAGHPARRAALVVRAGPGDPAASGHARRRPGDDPESTAMAKELKRRGMRFVGPTTCYALMQATGLVDDHVQHCWRAAAGPAR